MLAVMCGRFTQARSWSELVQLYDITKGPAPSNFAPRYNIAPTQDIAVVRSTADARETGGSERELVMLRWGLVPFWAKDAGIGARMINARAETVRTKPAFREAFRRRRCLIAADGFYEWRKENPEQTRADSPEFPEGKRKPAASKTPARKQPYYITRAGGGPFALAGLWEQWTPPGGQRLESCTIVTAAASDEIAWIHDRMPVMLEPDQFGPWLSAPADGAEALLRPSPGPLTAYPVSTRVNSVRNDDVECIAPVPPAPDRLL
jgi:putative SOS response-associated peptidase YedK